QGIVRSFFIISGYDTLKKKPMLFSLDPYGTLTETNLAALGDLKTTFTAISGEMNSSKCNLRI
ncbi:MAG: hypothetical protein MHPSP_002674, partial [Paramarteilia canceri]